MEKRVFFKSDDLRLVGEIRYPKSQLSSFPALCICHGIPSNNPPSPDDKGYPFLAEKLCEEGFLTLIFNFRGTGESEGNFDILGWTRDLSAALDFLWESEKVDKSRISLLGFSGGAAVSICVAAKDKRISSVVACSCPAKFFLEQAEFLLEQARQIGMIRDSNFPPSSEKWLQNFSEVIPLKYVEQISPRPLLLMHGEEDEVVPLSHAQELYQKAEEPKELFIVKGEGHRLRQSEEAMNFAASWLKKN
jgi:dipeptidyl aminopeptidase/acylaminoacyl peptidase